jgi:hypothetical protein
MESTSCLRVLARGFLAVALLSVLALVAGSIFTARADDHVVSSQALQQQMQNSTATRRQNIDTVTRFLSTPIAERTMQAEHYDAVQVKNAIPALSDAELANLAARARNAQQQFSAGVLGIGMLTLIILLVVVIIVVAAVH